MKDESIELILWFIRIDVLQIIDFIKHGDYFIIWGINIEASFASVKKIVQFKKKRKIKE